MAKQEIAPCTMTQCKYHHIITAEMLKDEPLLRLRAPRYATTYFKSVLWFGDACALIYPCMLCIYKDFSLYNPLDFYTPKESKNA